MTSYTVRNTAGNTVATIGVATTTGSAFPIELLGQGISLYGGIVAQDLYWLLENFANPTPPTAPVEGMFWYDSALKIPNYYNGTDFIPLAGAGSSSRILFKMLPRATAIDFTVAGPVRLVTRSSLTTTYHPTQLMLVPNKDHTITRTTPAAFHLYIRSSEDVMEIVTIDPAVNNHITLPIHGLTRYIKNLETCKLNIVTPVTGGECYYDAYLFGFTRF